MKLVFATNNPNKLKEAKSLLSNKLEILSLKDIGCEEELPETHDTLEENAFEKANYVYTNYSVNCFSEDTGLEIDALNGAPGVYSARYAGEHGNAEANMDLVLKNMKDVENRAARFRTIISLIIDGKKYQFEGIVTGEILKERVGADGFGYDPIFRPNGYETSFAEMPLEQKSSISHRGEAIRKLVSFLMSSSVNY